MMMEFPRGATVAASERNRLHVIVNRAPAEPMRRFIATAALDPEAVDRRL